MHAGINCIQAQQSRARYGCCGRSGVVPVKILAQDKCHPKTKYIGAHSDHQKCIKGPKTIILDDFVLFAD
jgi:hypothetical protein